MIFILMFKRFVKIIVIYMFIMNLGYMRNKCRILIIELVKILGRMLFIKFIVIIC